MPAIHLTDRDLKTVAQALRELHDRATGATLGTPHQHDVKATLEKIEEAQRRDQGVTQ